MKKSIIALLFILFLIAGCTVLEDKDIEESVMKDIEEDKVGIEKEDKIEEIIIDDSDDEMMDDNKEKVNEEPLTIEDKLKESDYYIDEYANDYIEYFEIYNDKSVDKIILDVNIGLDHDFYGEIKTSNNPGSTNVLCNKYNAVPEDYTPEDLVTIPKKYHINDGKEYLIAKRLLEAYELMYQVAKDEGLDLKIASAYRSYNTQEYLYNKYSTRHGKEKADTFSARPGHSEHETGLAIDFSPIRTSFEDTEEFNWLMNNAYQYGFLLRYPNDKENVTGYKYEPWHFRYVGKDIARIVYDEKITYDEYYAKYILPN